MEGLRSFREHTYIGHHHVAAMHTYGGIPYHLLLVCDRVRMGKEVRRLGLWFCQYHHLTKGERLMSESSFSHQISSKSLIYASP